MENIIEGDEKSKVCFENLSILDSI